MGDYVALGHFGKEVGLGAALWLFRLDEHLVVVLAERFGCEDHGLPELVVLSPVDCFECVVEWNLVDVE